MEDFWQSKDGSLIAGQTKDEIIKHLKDNFCKTKFLFYFLFPNF